MLAPNPPFEAPDQYGDLFAPACVDIFAGAGGWSTGTEQAFADAGWRDRRIDLMINHCSDAVGVHKLNHPLTEHVQCNVLEVDPRSVLIGRRIAYLHLSPDCTDHSKAKGDVPLRKHIRALADVGLVWARARRPDVITLENVEEWKQWGPLLPNGRPDKKKRGQEFRRWCRELEDMGYVLEVRELRACDLGVPTTRKRLFVIARCDGKPIVWPEKSHGTTVDSNRRNYEGRGGRTIQGPKASGDSQKLVGHHGIVRSTRTSGGVVHGRSAGGSDYSSRPLKPYMPAGDCLEWWRPMLSIFATPAEAKAFAKQHKLRGIPKRPLKPKTLSRVAGGAFRFVLETPRPYVVHIDNYGWNTPTMRGVDESLTTVTAGPKGGKHALVDVQLSGYSIPRYGEAKGQSPRCQSIHDPAAAVTGTGNGTNLVAGVLSRYNTQKGDESRCHPLDESIRTLDTQNRYALLVGNLMKYRGNSVGTSLDEPAPTITSGAGAQRPAGHAHGLGVSAAFLSHFYTSNTNGGQGDPRQPSKTITSGGQHSCVAATTTAPYLVAYYGEGSGKKGHTPADPMPTVVSRARFALVTAEGGYWPLNERELERAKKVARFLIRELGHAKMARHLVWVRDRAGRKTFALVRVVINGEPRLMTDLLLRMLYPRELANCTGFPSNYIIDRTFDGKKLSTAAQVKLIGNAVPPEFARQIVKLNVVDQGVLGDPVPQKRRVKRQAVLA